MKSQLYRILEVTLITTFCLLVEVTALKENDNGKEFVKEIKHLRDENQLREGLAKFHSKEYQDEKVKFLSSKEYQEKKEKYFRENPRNIIPNGQFVSMIGEDDLESTKKCYEPIKYQKSGCCSQKLCNTFGCMVNKGKIDSNTLCDPLGHITGTPSFVFCSENGCKNGNTCSDCWCGKLDYDHRYLVDYDLSHDTLYYAFTTEWIASQAGCVNCFNNGDVNAMKAFMEKHLNPGKCLPQFDGKAHNGMRCARDNYCKSGRCSKGLTCEDKRNNGSSCGEDDDCKSGRCASYFHCADKIDKGDFCGNNGDCKSNKCVRDWWGVTLRCK